MLLKKTFVSNILSEDRVPGCTLFQEVEIRYKKVTYLIEADWITLQIESAAARSPPWLRCDPTEEFHAWAHAMAGCSAREAEEARRGGPCGR